MTCKCTPERCLDCGEKVPHGHGIGWSATDDEWTDRTKSRPIARFDPLCRACTVLRMFQMVQGPEARPKR